MWKRLYHRLTKAVDWLWKGNLTQSSIANCLVPAAAEECVVTQVNCTCCGTKSDRADNPRRDVRAGTDACPSAPEKTQPPAIENVPEHYTALLGAFPSSEEFQASISEPESESEAMPEKG
ncbi:MAG: hypothetical protein LBJ01_07035 [Tannerella sp.]|jgi:hypothetical protein|nr:hypothetical protein [Tannerella sp.]